MEGNEGAKKYIFRIIQIKLYPHMICLLVSPFICFGYQYCFRDIILFLGSNDVFVT